MKFDKQISIIVPIYNTQKYLRECIESVTNQKEFNNVELILIDDGSTDNSGKICDEYQEMYENIIVIHKENEGQAVARNIGIKQARGKYILFLDSDDFLCDNSLKHIMNTINDENLDLIMYSVYKYPAVDQPYFMNTELYEKIDYLTGIEALKKILKIDCSFGWCCWWYVIKRDLLIQNNIYFPKGMLSEDIYFSFNLWLHAKQCKVINEVLYNYRINNQNSTTRVASFKFIDDIINVIIKNLEIEITDNELAELMYINYQTLINVVLFWYTSFNLNERKFLLEKINKINKIYKVKLNKVYKINKKQFVVNLIIKIIGFNNLGNIWGIKRKCKK